MLFLCDDFVGVGLLNRSLPDIAEEIERSLARAIEVGDDEVPRHDMNFRSPAGREWERTPTPLRHFCLPFEDLLNAAPRQSKQKGRIARDSIAPIWTWLREILLPFETRSYRRNFKSAIAAADHAQAKLLAADFWRVAGAAMRAALASEPEQGVARKLMRNEHILADAAEAALMLSIAPTVMTIQDHMVRPVPVLTDELLHALRAIRERLVLTEPDAAPYVTLVAMNRLARPWEALKIASRR